MGWVESVACATLFSPDEARFFDLPMSSSGDARYLTLRQAVLSPVA
jgi:hypothetical protein